MLHAQKEIAAAMMVDMMVELPWLEITVTHGFMVSQLNIRFGLSQQLHGMRRQ